MGSATAVSEVRPHLHPLRALGGGTAGARRPTRRSIWLLALAVVALAAACVPPENPNAPNSAGLTTTLRSGSIDLEWTTTLDGTSFGYEVQFASATSPWTTFAHTTEPWVSFTDVTPLTSYSFRVRDGAAPGAPAKTWSPQVNVVYVEPKLPVLRIDTTGRAPILDRENYVRATMTLDPNGSGFAPYTGTLDIRGRGNTTWLAPKKPYRLRLDTKSALMGIASNRHWALLANYNDKSQLRTYAASEISRATDLDFTPSYRHVEVILNGRYEGVYQLTEHIRTGSDRIDIEEMGPEDNSGVELTGGYLLEVDERLEENHEPGFRTQRHVPVVVKEPDPMTPEQRAYITGHVAAFENALFSPSYADPTLGYRRYLDEHAFADHYLVHEIARNQDTFFSSTFFSKQRGEDQFVFGPMWDFDLSMGVVGAPRTLDPTGWAQRTSGPWIARIFTDPTFVTTVEQRWAALAPQIAGLPDQIEALGDSLQPAIDNDEARWGYQLEHHDSPQYVADWLRTRLGWIGGELD